MSKLTKLIRAVRTEINKEIKTTVAWVRANKLMVKGVVILAGITLICAIAICLTVRSNMNALPASVGASVIKAKQNVYQFISPECAEHQDHFWHSFEEAKALHAGYLPAQIKEVGKKAEKLEMAAKEYRKLQHELLMWTLKNPSTTASP